MMVFSDCDGVLANFNQQFFNLFEMSPTEIPDDDMWELINSHTHQFWPSMPLMYGAKELFEILRPYNPIILTGCHKDNFDEIAKLKTIWVKQNFGEDTQIICCRSRNKPLYMNAPGDILIDDFKSNTRRWIKAGGVAVQYRTFEQAVEDFKIAVAGFVMNIEGE